MQELGRKECAIKTPEAARRPCQCHARGERRIAGGVGSSRQDARGTNGLIDQRHRISLGGRSCAGNAVLRLRSQATADVDVVLPRGTRDLALLLAERGHRAHASVASRCTRVLGTPDSASAFGCRRNVYGIIN